MTDTEARAMALALGYKLVKHVGEDRKMTRSVPHEGASSPSCSSQH